MNTQLPILDTVEEIKTSLAKHNTLILQAPPGAGKSTVLPLELLQKTWLDGQKILRLEPHRLAARIGLIIFDAFHERSLHTDLSLALVREVQQFLRQDLRKFYTDKRQLFNLIDRHL